MPQKCALIVDDEPDIRELLEITLGRMDIETHSAADLKSARNLLVEQTFDFCLTDMQLPDGNGISLIEHIQLEYPRLPVAMITAHGNMESAVEALKAGAFDFVSKPVNLELLRHLVNTALNLEPLNAETHTAKLAICCWANLRSWPRCVDKLLSWPGVEHPFISAVNLVAARNW